MAESLPPEPPGSADGPSGLSLIAAGAAFAAAELLAGILLFGFFSLGRAEALLFYAFRPWLLLVAALLVSRRPLGQRLVFYLAALLLAGLSQSLFLVELGAAGPWLEAARGLAAGAALAAVADAAIQLGRRLLKQAGAVLAAAALAALLVVPGGLTPYEAIVLAEPKRAPQPQPDLMLMSALPLMWSELGPLDPKGRPAAAYKALEREFRIRPLDVLDAAGLGRGRLLLLAQPRALAPAELVALDAWVRRGGRALILTDPMLLWPSELPLGDIRRPPAIGLLGPLLDHWGLALEPPRGHRAEVEQVSIRGQDRRMILFGAGRFSRLGAACAIRSRGFLADCRIGEGRALLLADADLMHDRLWAGEGAAARRRHVRISDNPLILADLLDELSGERRTRAEGPIEWITPSADRRLALALAFLPLGVAAAPAVWSRLRRRR
jgi:hypothetical protein